ncbi:cytochrome P450 [Glomus cerebriforme]|uniref:Cytochrome P450 n=1 Tax=Glomus cerebriforme TaxID=658196 RepID=A0A397TC80_9GLOM|nr:cytochrome P450 [Glomus cerebriforme]
MLFFKEFNQTILEILILIILVFILSILKFYYDYFTRSTSYSGPLPVPILGNLHQYYYHRNDIQTWLQHLSLKYGDVFELYFGSCKYLMISDSRVVERVMSPLKDNNYFVRVTTKEGLEDLQKGHNGILFNVDFNSWSNIKKIFIKAVAAPNSLRFGMKLINNGFKDLEKFLDLLIEEREEKSIEVDFIPWTRRVFAEAIMLLLTNRHPDLLSTYYNRITNKNPDNIQKNLHEEFFDRLNITSDCVQYYLMVPSLIRNLPFVNFYTSYLYNNMMWTRNYMYSLVKERIEENESIDYKEKLLSPDMLNLLLSANISKDNDGNEKPMTIEEIGDNIAEILIEGVDSPSNTLSFFLYYVGNDPDIERRVLEEIGNTFNHRPKFNITYEDLNKLEYIEAVIKEVLRIRPVTATISRFTAHPDQINEYKIPPSTQLSVNIMGLHMNPNYWEEPMKFNPSRFLGNNEKETYDKNAFVYFGGGIRMCPGRQFAMTQLKMMVVLLYSKYKFEVITKDPSSQYSVNTQCKELKVRIKHKK